uniref:N-acetylaspartylglutamate synthase n=1 Tax=Felis catus TaxID=9685 RepID=A0ABI7ZGW2_FELCA
MERRPLPQCRQRTRRQDGWERRSLARASPRRAPLRRDILPDPPAEKHPKLEGKKLPCRGNIYMQHGIQTHDPKIRSQILYQLSQPGAPLISTCLQLNQKALTTFPDVVLVRVPTPSVQSDSDITVLRHLEKLGCRLVNRPQSILNCVNKFWTFQELAGHGVPMPDTFSYGGHDDFSKMIDEAEPLGYPVVVKSTRGHRGKAVFLARDKHHLSDICHLIRHDVPYLFQKYVKESHGKDIRVVVVGGRVIGSMLRCSTDGRMQSNCSLGGVGVMCPLTEQGKQLAIQVSNILGMDFCGIDLLIMDDGSFVVCEANANVGFLAFDQACNLDVGGIIADYTMSLLPNRQTGKMAVLPGLSSPREKKEPDGCTSAQGVAESVYAINNGSTSSESEPELGEIRDSSVSTAGAPPPLLPEPGYNINNRIASELKLK